MRQYLKFRKETTYGTAATGGTPILNTDYILVDLDGDSAFTMRPQPRQVILRSFASFNRRNKLVQAYTDVTGSVSFPFYADQAQFVLDMALKLTSNNTSSYTIDHAFVGEDGSNTTQYRRYISAKVSSFTLSASAQSPIWRVNMNLVAQKPQATNITSSDFAVPAYTDYPSDNPLLFTHLASPGYLTFGSSRSDISSVEISVNNMLDPVFNESQYITSCKWRGRDVDVTHRIMNKTLQDRLDFEAIPQVAKSCSISIADSASTSVQFDFSDSNFVLSVDDDMQIDGHFYQTVRWGAFLDATDATDLTYTVDTTV